MAPRRLVVLWRVTERCNLACAFCAYDRRLARSRRSVGADPVLRFGELLGGYARSTGARVLVSWLGGEPLTWLPLSRVSQTLRERHGLALSLTTNGTRLDQPWLQDLLISHYDEVTVSVDGMGGVHDQLRGREGLFEQLACSVKRLASAKQTTGHGPLLRANVVLMRNNVAAFAPLCHELARWGVEEITFNQLGGNDRPAFFPGNRLLPGQAEQLSLEIPALRAELVQRQVTLRGNGDYLGRIKASSAGHPLPRENCAPGTQFLFIDEEGRVAPCGFTGGEYGVALDELTCAQDIMELPARFAARRRSVLASACGDCPSTQQHGKFALAAV